MSEQVGTGARVAARDASAAFVELASSLVDEFDLVEMSTSLATHGVHLLGAAAAGILLVDGEGTLRVVGSSDERPELLELLQVQNFDGPCLECYRTGRVVVADDLRTGSPWPEFAAASVSAGYVSLRVVPMRLKQLTLGCFILFLVDAQELGDDDLAVAQGLADVAGIAIVRNQAVEEAATRERHLQGALESRVVIEQAKGMIAVQRGVDVDAAFAWLRNHSRNANRRLTDVAQEVVRGSDIALR